MIFKNNKAIRIRVAAIVIEDNRILLVAHKKKNDVYWLLPGGGVDFGESLKEALKREVLEELGVIMNINDIALVCDSICPDGLRHNINICFHCSYIEGKYSLSNEKRLHNFGFFTISELQNLQIIPPIKKELKEIIVGNKNESVYLGERWMNL